MRTCKDCGIQLVERHKKLYCSNACQRAYERHLKVQEWLATGRTTLSGSRRHFVKMYLLAEQTSHCAICGTPAFWNGAELTLVLDHIDGNAQNNCRENLRLVCPNCDSQLPTYKSRNRGRGRAWRQRRYAEGKSY